MTDKTIGQQIKEEAELLQLTLIRQARVMAEGRIGLAVGGATGQTAAQQAAEQIAQLSGRTQTETSHLDDMNAGERIKATVARGADDNQVAAQAINGSITGITQAAGFGISTQMIGASVAGSQISANIPDVAMKNSNTGRGYGVLGLVGTGVVTKDAVNPDD